MLCREILKAFIQVHEVEQDRILGRYDNTLDTHAAVTSSTTESKKAGVLLSRAIDQFLDEKVSKKEFTPATVADCRSVYKVLLQVVGDVDIRRDKQRIGYQVQRGCQQATEEHECH